MRAWLDFAEGPMFRFAFALAVAGLARLVVISIRNIVAMRSRTPDKSTDVWAMVLASLRWLSPGRWLQESRPSYTATSFVFHVGLIVVPIFFLPHVSLWERGIGFGWRAIPATLADWLTLATIATGVALVAMRLADRGSRTMSRPQDWMLTPLCVVVFVTGYLAAHPALGPFSYDATRLVHVLSGNLLFVLMPFTKLAHIVLLPFTQVMADLSWKLVPGVGMRVREALGHPDRPV